MPTTDLPNNNISSSAPPPPPPPPLPPGGLNNWKLPQDNGHSQKSSSVATSENGSRTQLKRDQSKNSIQQCTFNLKESQLFRQKQEENNVNSETADEGSKNSIHVKNPETRNSAQSKEEHNASDKTKNDRSNTERGVPTQPVTEQQSSLAEQKKATGLKYSIATLLLCTSGTVAGVYTYFIISAVLSGAAVPVLFAVIAFVSALVMLSSAAYLINSHVSAINSEKGVDHVRKQSQDSALQKGTESLGHSIIPPISPPVMPKTQPSPSASPPLMPVKSNGLPAVLGAKRKSNPSDNNPKGVQQKQSDTPVDARSNLLAAIRQPRTLKKIPDEKKNYLPKDSLKIPQKQEEESVAEKRENGVQTLNQSQKSDSQAAKKLEHSNSDTTTGPIRKVKNQKTDKEPSNSEGIQQIIAIAIQKQRGRSGFQNEQLDSLDEQEDSLCSLGESLTEPKKPFNKEQKKYVEPLNASRALQNTMLSTNPLLNSLINNLSSNSGNAPDYGDWKTEPNSIDINLDKTRQEMRQEKKEKGASPSATKGSGADQVSNEVQDPSTLPLNERREIFAAKV